MDVLLVVLGFSFLILGLAGAVLPIPGPPVSFLGLLLLHFTSYIHFTSLFLIGFGSLAALVTVLDYLIPVWGAKKFGGSKWGSWGSAFGMVIGLFLGPFGLFLGAFLGAFMGEYLANINHKVAFKAALGSFLGLLVGIVFKVVLCSIMLFYAVKAFI